MHGNSIIIHSSANVNEFTLVPDTHCVFPCELLPSIVDLSNGNALLTFINATYLFGQILSRNATLLSNFAITNTTTTAKPTISNLDTDLVFVAWQGNQTGDTQIYGRFISLNGTLHETFTVNQNTSAYHSTLTKASTLNVNFFHLSSETNRKRTGSSVSVRF